MKQYYVQPDRDAYQSVHGIDSVLFTLLLKRNRSLVQEFAEFAAQSSDISVARIFWVRKGADKQPTFGCEGFLSRTQ